MRDSGLETIILYGALGSAILSFHDPCVSLLLKGCGSRGGRHCTESGRHHSLSSPNKFTQGLQTDNATSALLSTPRCGVGAEPSLFLLSFKCQWLLCSNISLPGQVLFSAKAEVSNIKSEHTAKKPAGPQNYI